MPTQRPQQKLKSTLDTVDSIIAIYLGKEDKRQGITSDPVINLNQRIGNASSYTGTRQSGLTSTENTLIKHAKDALNKALDKTNTFFNIEWKPYQSAMEELETTPFKEIKSFKID